MTLRRVPLHAWPSMTALVPPAYAPPVALRHFLATGSSESASEAPLLDTALMYDAHAPSHEVEVSVARGGVTMGLLPPLSTWASPLAPSFRDWRSDENAPSHVMWLATVTPSESS